jgi:hypothetical protein
VQASTGASIVPGTDLVPGSQCADCVATIALPFRSCRRRNRVPVRRW